MKIGRLITLQENPVEAREDVGKVIREEMLAALQGSGFFDEMAAYAGAGLGRGLSESTPAPTQKRKLTDKMRRRNKLVRKLMREEGLSLPSASKAVKVRGLA